MLCSEVAKGAPRPKDLVQGKRVGRKAFFRYPNYRLLHMSVRQFVFNLNRLCGVIAKMEFHYKSDKISRHEVVSAKAIHYKHGTTNMTVQHKLRKAGCHPLFSRLALTHRLQLKIKIGQQFMKRPMQHNCLHNRERKCRSLCARSLTKATSGKRDFADEQSLHESVAPSETMILHHGACIAGV